MEIKHLQLFANEVQTTQSDGLSAEMKTFYDKVTENAPTYNGNLAGLPGTNVYYRKSMCYGVGIDITL